MYEVVEQSLNTKFRVSECNMEMLAKWCKNKRADLTTDVQS